MASQAVKEETLRRALEQRLSLPIDWWCDEPDALAPGHGRECWGTLRKSRTYGELVLTVLLRFDGDVDVRFDVAGHSPSELEVHFILPEGGEDEAIDEIASIVGQFVEERIVLGYDDSWLSGGRRLLAVGDLERPQGKLKWVVSWNGTYDSSR